VYWNHFSYFKGTGRVGRAVKYIAHREERLPGGQGRELYGVGDRYRALRGDEAAIIRQLKEDARGLKAPRYYRVKLTLDDRAAQRLSRLNPAQRELVLRDAVDKTFRGAFRQAQGVFVVHENERGNRPFGNPHVHALLAPRLVTGEATFIPRQRLAPFRQRWEREVVQALRRYERQRMPERTREPPREREQRAILPPRRGRGINPAVAAVAAQLAHDNVRGAAATAARALPGALGRAARLRRDLEEAATSPDRLLRRRTFQLLTRLLPTPLRRAVNVTRTLGLLVPKT
jgi:hypothetical protein